MTGKLLSSPSNKHLIVLINYR